MKSTWVSAIVLALVAFLFVGCSKDDNSPSGGSIDAAVGTFQGSLEVTGQDARFNQTIVVTKVSNERIRVKVGDASLNLPDREFNVTNNANIAIQSASISTGGDFIYDVREQSVIYQSAPMAEGEVLFTFKGNKQ
ncbi:hypothetical protein M8998_07935 [Sphingobacterium sp. lm-10]|uniref:hypothetical protein n=1 Tax=Sphingobacterium sp. lm-10 TaxID=2944904 RepID=UPI0020214728|nr:hypothetical protein [Sphingobacterium sp. lm-10]MCL7987865.1 hypothetical protein [Sphingobacterium sp. lm-10]